MFQTSEITKLLDVMIGPTSPIGNDSEDRDRLEHLKQLIDIVNWCLDGMLDAAEAPNPYGESSVNEIKFTARQAMLDWHEWIEGSLEL